MPFKTPVFKNSQSSTCEHDDDDLNSVLPNNQNEVFVKYETVPINTSDFQNTRLHTKRPAAVASLENVADIPLEEASQENELGKKEKAKIFAEQIGKENLPNKNVQLGTVKKSAVKREKLNKVTPNKVAKSAKKDKNNNANGYQSIWTDAHNLKKKETMSRNGVISFEQRDASQNSYHCSQNTMSQQSYQMALSQPPSSMTHHQRLMWLQERREVGLWVECNHQHCQKWRYLPHMHDPTALPNLWYCHMNPDKRYNSCSVDEKRLTVAEEQDLIYSAYTAGSVVWARQLGFPWWPAMVDDCPDTEEYYWLDGFSDIPTHFNVVFFDNLGVTRCWLTPRQLQPFQTAKVLIKNGKYRDRILAAKHQAVHALTLGITERLKKFSFISRFSGPILSPKPIRTNRKIKYVENVQQEFSREVYSSSESDIDDQCLEMSGHGPKDSAHCAIVEDSDHSTPLRAMKNVGTVYGARSLAILEEAELMGTANTESTWQPPTSYSAMDDTTDDSYGKQVIPSQQQTKITSMNGTGDGHLTDSGSNDFQF